MSELDAKALAWIDYRAEDLKSWIRMCPKDEPVRAVYIMAHNTLVNLRERITSGAPKPEGYPPATEPVY
jgi:hypothetical protein